MAITITKGSVSAKMSGGLAEAVKNALRKCDPVAVPIMERAIVTLQANAEAKWPKGRERGREHSKDMFENGLRTASDGVEAFLRNQADYAFYIKSDKNGLGGKSAFQVLLRKPLKESAASAAKEIAENVGALLGGK